MALVPNTDTHRSPDVCYPIAVDMPFPCLPGLISCFRYLISSVGLCLAFHSAWCNSCVSCCCWVGFSRDRGEEAGTCWLQATLFPGKVGDEELTGGGSKDCLSVKGLKHHPLMLQVLLMAPSEVAKVRMQTQRNPHPSVASPQPVPQPKYRGSLHCLKVIAKEEGFCGLYKGCSALLCRDCSSSAIYFLTYSALCDWLTPAGKNKPGRYQKASGIICKGANLVPG